MDMRDILSAIGLGVVGGIAGMGAMSQMGGAKNGAAAEGPSVPKPQEPPAQAPGFKVGDKIPMSSVTTSAQQQASAQPMAAAGVPMQSTEARMQALLAKYPQAAKAMPQQSQRPWSPPNLMGQAQQGLSDYWGNAQKVPPSTPQEPSAFAPGSDLTTALGQAFAQQDEMKKASQMRAQGVWGNQPAATPPWKQIGWRE